MVTIIYYIGDTIGKKCHKQGGSLKKYSLVTRGVIGAVVSAALALPMSSVVHAADPVSVPMVTSPALGSMPVFVAIAKGFDAKEALETLAEMHPDEGGWGQRTFRPNPLIVKHLETIFGRKDLRTLLNQGF